MTLDAVATAFVAALVYGFAYLATEYLLYRTTLAQRIKRGGLPGCPRYPHKDLVFGSDFQKAAFRASAAGDRQSWFRRQFAEHGKTFEVNHWGKRIYHTADTANSQTVLSLKADNFGLGPSRMPARPWLGDGIFTTDGSYWRHSRNLLKPIFAKNQISNLPRLDEHLNGLFQRLEQRRYEADLQPLFLKMYLDYSIDFLFGDSTSTITGDGVKVDADAFIAACDKSLLQVARSHTPWLLRWLYGWTKDWNKTFQTSQGFVELHVETALKNQKGNLASASEQTEEDQGIVFLDQLVRQTGSKNTRYLRDQMLNIFFPARDASGIGISLVMFKLARHPRVWEKIRREVLSADQVFTYESVKNLQYVNAVVNETLRLYGPAGHALRDVLQNTILPSGGGINGDQPMYVPRGSAVVIHMHAIQRDRTAWGDDADDFRPERWLETSKAQQRRSWEYLPFLGGPRICPGQPMVLAQYAFIIARFAQRFTEIQNRDSEARLVEEHKILMKIRNGVQVRLVR